MRTNKVAFFFIFLQCNKDGAIQDQQGAYALISELFE